MRAKFAEIGGEPLAGSPSEFGQLIAEETEKRFSSTPWPTQTARLR
jgi:hypothetical protein